VDQQPRFKLKCFNPDDKNGEFVQISELLTKIDELKKS